MTVQDMDITLNISSAPVTGKPKMAVQRQKEFFKPHVKRLNKKFAKKESRNDSAEHSLASNASKRLDSAHKMKIKQKSLTAIFDKKDKQFGGQMSMRNAAILPKANVKPSKITLTEPKLLSSLSDAKTVGNSINSRGDGMKEQTFPKSFEKNRVDRKTIAKDLKTNFNKSDPKVNRNEKDNFPKKEIPVITESFKKNQKDTKSIGKNSKQSFKKTDSNVGKKARNFKESHSSVDDGDANQITVQFSKSSQEIPIKTILARKRDVKTLEDKKSLSDIFTKNSEPNDTQINLLSLSSDDHKTRESGEKRKFEENKKSFSSKSAKKLKFEDKKNKKIEEREQKDLSPKNLPDERNTKTNARHSGGKISSLFGNNPEVPNIGQRLVKPVYENVFSGTNFCDFDIHSFTISNLEQNMQITKLTTVQQKAIPEILSGKDVLIRSQTGSGKTLAYALPIVECLQKIRPKLSRNSGLKALVVVPTRELALQTYECFLKLIKPFTWIVPGYLVGGEKRKAEKARLRRGCTILVATPGRLLDHIKHTEALRLNDIKCFVLDEADRMLDMGYEKDISGIVAALEQQKNSLNFGLKQSLTAEDDDSSYNPLKLLRQNSKKTFTDDETSLTEEDQSKIDETNVKKENIKTEDNSDSDQERSGKSAIKREPQSNSDDSEDENSESENLGNVKNRKEYHSGTDSDEDDAEQDFPIRRQKLNKNKSNPDLSKTVAKNSSKFENEKKINEKETTPSHHKSDESWVTRSERQTILLSATLTQAVEKLAGLTMESPVFVDAAKENLEKFGGNLSEINEDLIVPQSVAQSYVVTPPKLRLVTLCAYVAGKCQNSGQHKILVFMATQDMVDYHADVLSSVLCKPSDDSDDDSEPLVDVEFFKLHGNMTQKERTEVFKTFRKARSGVLLCTDVASRGLDLPKVDSVVQYTGPLSARDYVHRVGRTARAGSSGTAIVFLTPPEVEFVRMLESRRVRIQREDMDDVLDKLLGPLSRHNSVEAAATALQNEFETLVLEDRKMHEKACKAYVSWMRFYASYPKDMREIFDRKELHLGHYAKSFGLRDPPQKIGGIGKTLQDNKKIHDNRLTNERPKKVFLKKDASRSGPREGTLKRVRMLNTSEYGSGLEPAKKSKKF